MDAREILLSITKSCDASGPIKLHVMPRKIDVYLSTVVAVTDHNNNNDVLSTRLMCSSDDK